MKLTQLALASITTASLLLFSSTALAKYTHHKAQPRNDYKGEIIAPLPCVECKLEDGFYVGVEGSYESDRVSRSVNITDSDGDNITSSHRLSATGWDGGLFVGYGHYFNSRFYLGAELSGDAKNSESNYSFTSTSTSTAPTEFISINGSAKIKSEYGIALLPGFKINNDLLIYVRLSYDWANLRTSETLYGTPTDTGITTSRSETEGGFDYGVGLEGSLCHDLSLRGEYVHADYGSFTTSIGSRYKFSTNAYKLGLIYHFV